MPKFDLERALDLLPEVKRLTADAVSRAEHLAGRMQEVPPHDPRRSDLEKRVREIVREWVSGIALLGAEAKGLWLVDFDSGEGFYYCWQHPEESIDHLHTYEGGFAARQPIVPETLH